MKTMKTMKTLAVIIVLAAVIGSTFAIAQPSTAYAATTTVKDTKRYVKPKTAKVYTKASTESKVVATLNRDKKVKITTEPNSAGWVKIKWSSNKGYIKLSKLAKTPRIVRFAKKEYNSEIKPVAEKYDWEIVCEDFSDFRWTSQFKCYFLESIYRFRNENCEIIIHGYGSDDPDYGIGMFYDVRIKNDSSNVLYMYQTLTAIQKYLEKYS